MTTRKRVKGKEPTTIVANDPEDRKGALKTIGGSQSDSWNTTLANQAVQTLWATNSDSAQWNRQLRAMVAALVGISPKDELEGMIAAQLIAAHNAGDGMLPSRHARRADLRGTAGEPASGDQVVAHLGDLARSAQPPSRQRPAEGDGRACPRPCGRSGRRRHSRSPRGGGGTGNRRNNSMQSRLPMHLSPRCGAQTRTGRPCRSPAMMNRRCRMHGGVSPGAPRGNANARKHGLYTAEAHAARRTVAALIRAMRGLVEEIDGQD